MGLNLRCGLGSGLGPRTAHEPKPHPLKPLTSKIIIIIITIAAKTIRPRRRFVPRPRMGTEEGELKKAELKGKVFQILEDFLTRVAKLEELGSVGSRFLNGFHQGLEFHRRPPLNTGSALIQNIIKANETKRLKSYLGAGCVNTHDGIQNMNKLNTCISGLRDHLSKAKGTLDELQHLVEDLSGVVQTSNRCLFPVSSEDSINQSDQQAPTDQEKISSSDPEELEITDYAALMGIIYSMVKQDFVMQERIITSLNLKSSSEELETYCMMWSLRPFVNDELTHKAWNLIR